MILPYNPNFTPAFYPQGCYQPPMMEQAYRQPQYQQPVQAPQMQPMQQPQAQGGGILWVQGEEGAKAYMVAPGNSVLLMDSEKNYFFIKSVDQSGMPSMRRFEYQEINDQKDGNLFSSQFSSYVQKTEFEELKKEVAGIIQILSTKSKEPNDPAQGS